MSKVSEFLLSKLVGFAFAPRHNPSLRRNLVHQLIWNISQFFIGVLWISGVEFDVFHLRFGVTVCQLDAELCPEAKAKALSFFGAHMLLLFLHQSILHIL